jgi:hypothetical protein
MKQFDDREHILHGDYQICCVKKRGGAKLYEAFGVIVKGRPCEIYLRGDDPADDFKEAKTYEDVDAMLADGWVVD